MAQLAGILEAFGMHPVGFHDLRDAAPTPVPVVSTAFRPIEADELAQNPFRLFVSVLVPEDRRFFTPDLAARVRAFLAARTLFPPRLLELARRARADGGLDRSATDELQRVSSVAADIAGVPSTHINHLTPRVLDIDALHARMTDLGVRMLDRIEGPPRWAGPDVLLRQTRFRALDERRLLREADGTVVEGALRVRFGEVESRGVALTPAGRERYDAALAAAAGRSAPDRPTPAVLAECWAEHFPASSAATARSAIGRQDAAPRDVGWLCGVLGRTVHDPQQLYRAQTERSLAGAAEALGLRVISDDRRTDGTQQHPSARREDGRP